MMTLRSGTVGVRFTILYAAAFLVSGVGLLALSFVLSGGNETRPAPAPGSPAGVATAQERIDQLEDQLAHVHSQQKRQLLIGSLVALGVLGVISPLVGRAMARRVLRPLRVITAATRRITADNLDRRLALTGPGDEVKDLADTIDGLLGRLEAAFVAQRRFVANASHELRTPLATMRASLDVAVAKTDPAASTVALANRLRTQLDRVDHLLDGLLVLARAQHGALADTTAVSLGNLVAAAVADREEEITAKRLNIGVDVQGAVSLQGSPELLARLVGNLIDNAVKHNSPDGWVAVSASADRSESVLVVETGGPVFDQREVDRLAQPFERLGPERIGSSGLGLSIVAAVAAAHGGRLALLARPAGGLRVSVTLPSARAPVSV